MGLMARDRMGEDWEPIPEDLHQAICFGVWDLGTHFQERFGKRVHKVVIAWELPMCRADYEINGSKINLPRSVNKRYTLSLHKRADLRKDLEAWRGKKFTDEDLSGFDLKRLIGVPAQIQIIHNRVDEKIYSNITAIIKSPISTKATPERNPQFFSFEEKMEIPQNTPQWIQDLIRQSDEFKGVPPDDGGREAYQDHDEDLPF